jgi:hypothetical protein
MCPPLAQPPYVTLLVFGYQMCLCAFSQGPNGILVNNQLEAQFFFMYVYLSYIKRWMFVCMELIQIHISEPIWTKLCTHLLLGLEEVEGDLWTHNISNFPPFRRILLGEIADSSVDDGCRRQSPPLLRYIRDAARVGVTSRTWRSLCVLHRKRGEVNGMHVCVEMGTWWDGKEVDNELHLQLHCIYINDNVKPI